MATPTATAIRQEAAITRIAAAASKIGIGGEIHSTARDPEGRIAEILEWAADTLEQIAAASSPPAKTGKGAAKEKEL